MAEVEDSRNIFRDGNNTQSHYKCIICGQAYEKEISLYAHITSHSGEIMVPETSTRTNRKRKSVNETLKTFASSMNPNKENKSPRWTKTEPRTPKVGPIKEKVDGFESKRGYDCQVTYNGEEYECEVCLKKFKAKRGLTWHMKRTHDSVDFGYKCEICGEVYPQQEELEHHFKKAHLENVKVECDICGKSVRKVHLKSHKRTHVGLKNNLSEQTKEKNYECDNCKECFPSKKVLLLHLVKTHLNAPPDFAEEKQVEVKLDKKVKKKKAKLEKPFKCDVENCRYATSQVYLLKAHKFKHNPFYKCVTCQEKLPSRKELKTHMAIHGERPYKCDQCNKCYKDKHGLGWHKKVHHDPSRLKFTCELCGKTYPFDSLLTQHINLTHAVERQSVCDICGKNLSKTYLPMHRRTHGEKHYSCDVCQKTFLEKAYLKRHKMIHTGEKPYVCSVCGKLFRQHSTLIIHMRTHTGDRPYKCVLCENAYKTHHNLKKHYRRSGHKIV